MALHHPHLLESAIFGHSSYGFLFDLFILTNTSWPRESLEHYAVHNIILDQISYIAERILWSYRIQIEIYVHDFWKDKELL